MNALGKEDMESQNRVAAQGGLPPLVRLLRSPKTSENVLLTVIKVLGTMCIGEFLEFYLTLTTLTYLSINHGDQRVIFNLKSS